MKGDLASGKVSERAIELMSTCGSESTSFPGLFPSMLGSEYGLGFQFSYELPFHGLTCCVCSIF